MGEGVCVCVLVFDAFSAEAVTRLKNVIYISVLLFSGRLKHFFTMGYVFEYLIKKMSTFLLQLPGFKSLHPDDRCAIVKCKFKVSSTRMHSTC